MQYYRLKQLTETLSISKSTIYSWIQQGLFPKPIKIGRISLWNKEEVLNFLAQ
jgi:prophage regulatory protein